MRILLAYSGGLDTSWILARFAANEDHAVHTLTVDCGGLDADARAELEARSLALGAAQHHWVDARGELYGRVLRWLLAGNVLRGGVYPLCVGAERGLQARHLAEQARALGFDTVAHGCTGAGNDQLRFEAALHACAPGLRVLAPVRDEAPSRAAQRRWLEERGHPLPPSGGAHSVNQGLWGLTIGGGVLDDTAEALPEEAWHWTRGGHGTATAELVFEAGEPRAWNGRALEPVELIETMNRELGALGVGRGDHLGDTLLGIKGRIAFEAPAALTLIHAHAELEKLVLTESQRFWKDHLASVYGQRVHQGLDFDPFQRDVEALLASTQQRVSGTVTLAVAGGRVQATGLRSPHSLHAASEARYGEVPIPDTDPAGYATHARVLAEPARLYARAAAQEEEVSAELGAGEPAC